MRKCFEGILETHSTILHCHQSPNQDHLDCNSENHDLGHDQHLRLACLEADLDLLLKRSERSQPRKLRGRHRVARELSYVKSLPNAVEALRSRRRGARPNGKRQTQTDEGHFQPLDDERGLLPLILGGHHQEDEGQNLHVASRHRRGKQPLQREGQQEERPGGDRLTDWTISIPIQLRVI